MLLLADLLVNYLAIAEDYIKKLKGLVMPPKDASEESAQPLDMSKGIPRIPIDPHSDVLRLVHCYYSGWSNGNDLPLSGKKDESTDTSGVNSDPHMSVSDTQQNHRYRSTSPLRVVKADGWETVVRDGESQKHKPGWVAKSPGATMWIDLGDKLLASSFDILLIYLRSYQHMGMAHVSCLGACLCEPLTLDASTHHRHSVPDMSLLQAKFIPSAITSNDISSNHCLLEVKVLPESSSGEHKFKVIQVNVATWRNVSSELDAISKSRMNQLIVPEPSEPLEPGRLQFPKPSYPLESGHLQFSMTRVVAFAIVALGLTTSFL
jgi:hypothetical protein